MVFISNELSTRISFQIFALIRAICSMRELILTFLFNSRSRECSLSLFCTPRKRQVNHLRTHFEFFFRLESNIARLWLITLLDNAVDNLKGFRKHLEARS